MGGVRVDECEKVGRGVRHRQGRSDERYAGTRLALPSSRSVSDINTFPGV